MFSVLSISDLPSSPYSIISAKGRACDTCRRLKIKCQSDKRTSTSLVRPVAPCDQCRRSGLKCTYKEKPIKRGRPRKEDSREKTSRYPEHLVDLLDLISTPVSQPGTLQNEVGQAQAVSNDPIDDTLPAFTNTTDSQVYQPGSESLHYQSQVSTTDTSLVDNDLSLRPESIFHGVDTPRSDEIWSDIDQFFDTMYVIFPVLSYGTLASRLIMEPVWASIPDFRTLLLSIRLVNTAGQFRMALENRVPLFELIRQVEISRLDYEFADPPSLNAVVISLFLFTAYNVLEKHNRAFLYLDEALSLLEAVEPPCEEEQRRKLQIEQVLFNTEAATMAIYADNKRRPRARKPLSIGHGPMIGPLTMDTVAESDRVAMHLLHRLTEIHLAENAEALEGVDIEFEADATTLFWAVFNRHRYYRIQAADVVVTRQWQLSSKLVASLRQGRGISKKFRESIDLLGITAMSWICLLGEGELRIVGLGKLSGLAQNIHALAGGGRCQHILGGLTGAVIKEDHEKNFAPQLANVVMPMVSTVPAPIRSGQDNELWILNSTAGGTTMEATSAAVDVWETLNQDDSLLDENFPLDSTAW